MTEFSDELIERTIRYFKEDHNHIIDRETAIEYLHNLGGLFLAFAETENKESVKKI
jgi:hypothetical protein